MQSIYSFFRHFLQSLKKISKFQLCKLDGHVTMAAILDFFENFTIFGSKYWNCEKLTPVVVEEVILDSIYENLESEP